LCGPEALVRQSRRACYSIDCSSVVVDMLIHPFQRARRDNALATTSLILGCCLLIPALSLVACFDTADAFAPVPHVRQRPHCVTLQRNCADNNYRLRSADMSLSLEIAGGGGDGGGGYGGNNGGGNNRRGRGRRDDDNNNDDDDDDEDDDQSPDGKNKGGRSLLARLRRWAETAEGREDIFTYGISVVLAMLVRTFALEPRYIPSLSMYPTFDVGDQLFVEKVSSKWFRRPIQRGDVVVFSPPQALLDILLKEYGSSDEIKPKEALIKRVVAIEGDRAQVKRDGNLYVNGEVQKHAFTKEDKANYRYGPINVPKDNVLVLGDNRNESLDGHIWGCLPTDNIIGRAICVYWPPSRVGRKDNDK